MISTTEKEKIIDKFKTHEKDTGSAEVQIALLSEEIDKLLAHLQTHKKDSIPKKACLKWWPKEENFLNI